MKSYLKKLLVILVVLMLLFSINSKVFAMDKVISGGKSFLDEADSSKANIDEQKLHNLSDTLSTILLSVGIVIAVIIATVLGIQFMMSGAEGQAKVKEMLVPFVIGCIVVFGAFGIWKIALSIGNRLESAPSSDTTTIEQQQ